MTRRRLQRWVGACLILDGLALFVEAISKDIADDQAAKLRVELEILERARRANVPRAPRPAVEDEPALAELHEGEL